MKRVEPIDWFLLSLSSIAKSRSFDRSIRRTWLDVVASTWKRGHWVVCQRRERLSYTEKKRFFSDNEPLNDDRTSIRIESTTERPIYFADELGQLSFVGSSSSNDRRKIGDVSPSDVFDVIDRESQTKADIFLPAVLINERRIDEILRRVTMNPAFQLLGEEFNPDVIRGIVDVATVDRQTTKKTMEQIGCFSATTTTCLDQFIDFVVTNKPISWSTRRTTEKINDWLKKNNRYPFSFTGRVRLEKRGHVSLRSLWALQTDENPSVVDRSRSRACRTIESILPWTSERVRRPADLSRPVDFRRGSSSRFDFSAVQQEWFPQWSFVSVCSSRLVGRARIATSSQSEAKDSSRRFSWVRRKTFLRVACRNSENNCDSKENSLTISYLVDLHQKID